MKELDGWKKGEETKYCLVLSFVRNGPYRVFGTDSYKDMVITEGLSQTLRSLRIHRKDLSEEDVKVAVEKTLKKHGKEYIKEIISSMNGEVNIEEYKNIELIFCDIGRGGGISRVYRSTKRYPVRELF